MGDEFNEYEHNDLTSLAVRIDEVLSSGGERRVYKFNVITADSTSVKLTVWDGSPASDVDWKLGEWYLLHDVLIKKWSSNIELNASNKTTAEQIESPDGKFNRQDQKNSVEIQSESSKRGISIIHTTDTYVDRKNMGRKARQEDFLSALEEIITTAIEIDVDLVLHTGNLFWSNSPQRHIIDSCKDILRRAASEDIPVRIVPGERDISRTPGIIERFENEGLLSQLEQGWHQFGSVGLFACGYNAEDDIEFSTESLPDGSSAYIAAFHNDLSSAKQNKRVKQIERTLGTNLSAILVGHRTDPLKQSKGETKILSPGTPEHIIGKRNVHESLPDPIFFHYDIGPSKLQINTYEINARRLVGFKLKISASDTKEAIDEVLSDQLPSDAATVFEITGEKSPTAISKKEIQKVVEEHVSLARGYDERTESAPRGDTPNIVINTDSGTTKSASDSLDSDIDNNSKINYDTKTSGDSTSKGNDSSQKIICPVSDCSFDGSLSRVIHHVTEQEDELHSWDSLGYQTSWHFRQDHTNGAETKQAPQNSEGDENDSAEQKSNLKKIPGIASTRRQALQKAGYEDVEAVASADVDELSDVPKISDRTARCIQETAKYVCGHQDTIAAELAETLAADPDEIAEAYSSLAPAIVTPEEAKRSLKLLFDENNDASVFDLTEYSIQYRHFLFEEGFTTISDIAQASIDDLTEAKYIGNGLAESIRETARDFEQRDTPDQDLVKDPDSITSQRTKSTSTALAAALDATESRIESDIEELVEHGTERVEAEVTVTAKYHPNSDTTTLWEIRSIGLNRGHHLYHAGFRTAADIAEASINELAAVPLMSEATARRVQESARDLSNQSADMVEQLTDEIEKDPEEYQESENDAGARDNFSEIDSLHSEKTFPSAMVERDQWLLWKETSDGRKIPRAPWKTNYELQFVDAMDPSNWTTFQDAIEWAEKLPHSYELAFCLTRDDPIVFIDLDNAIREGDVTATAQELINRANSYTATSTSGTGLHIFVTGELSDGIKAITDELADDDGSIEVYDRNRFVAMTGDHFPSTPETLTPGSGFIEYLESEYAQVSSKSPDKATTVPSRSREELRNIETTSDIQDVFDAIAQTRPSDIRMRSTQTEERHDGTLSYDPSWTTSESGTRLGVLDEIWIYRDGMIALDALQIVALEEGIITDERDYPDGSDFWEAVEKLRNRGASIPRYEPGVSSVEKDAVGSVEDLPPESDIAQIINYREPIREYLHPYDRDYQEKLALELAPIILDSVSSLGLSGAVAYRAAELYMTAHAANIVPGQSHECTIAAALRIASLEAGTPRPWEEIGKTLDEKPKSIRNKFQRILKETDLSDSIDASDLIVQPEQYVPYLTTKLNIDVDSAILDEVKTRLQQNNTGSGASPLAVAAGAFYAVLKESDRYSATQDDLAQAANISKVTIRNNYKEFLT